MALKDFTKEERRELASKARFARLAVVAQWEENEHNLKLDYLDETHWDGLATKYKVRRPPYNQPADAKGIRKYLKKTGVSNETFSEHYTSVGYFLENDPKWSMAAVVGILLELKEGM